MPTTEPLTITIASLKGGTGKTTLAIHLTGALAAVQPPGTVGLLADDAPGQLSDGCLWALPGRLPFPVVLPLTRHWRPTPLRTLVIDGGRPATPAALRDLAEASDFLLLPVTPYALDVSTLPEMLGALDGVSHWAVVVIQSMPALPRQPTLQAALRTYRAPVLRAAVRYEPCMRDACWTGTLVQHLPDFAPDDGFGVWGDYLDVAREVRARMNVLRAIRARNQPDAAQTQVDRKGSPADGPPAR